MKKIEWINMGALLIVIFLHFTSCERSDEEDFYIVAHEFTAQISVLSNEQYYYEVNREGYIIKEKIIINGELSFTTDYRYDLKRKIVTELIRYDFNSRETTNFKYDCTFDRSDKLLQYIYHNPSYGFEIIYKLTYDESNRLVLIEAISEYNPDTSSRKEFHYSENGLLHYLVDDISDGLSFPLIYRHEFYYSSSNLLQSTFTSDWSDDSDSMVYSFNENGMLTKILHIGNTYNDTILCDSFNYDEIGRYKTYYSNNEPVINFDYEEDYRLRPLYSPELFRYKYTGIPPVTELYLNFINLHILFSLYE